MNLADIFKYLSSNAPQWVTLLFMAATSLWLFTKNAQASKLAEWMFSVPKAIRSYRDNRDEEEERRTSRMLEIKTLELDRMQSEFAGLILTVKEERKRNDRYRIVIHHAIDYCFAIIRQLRAVGKVPLRPPEILDEYFSNDMFEETK